MPKEGQIMTDPKPCPFCGSKAVVTKIIGINTLYGVYCSADENYCIKPSTRSYKTREEAVNIWNRRVYNE